MGYSVNVKVFYGYAWNENEEEGEIDLGDFSRTTCEDDDGEDSDGNEDDASPSVGDWIAVVAVRRGHVNPWDNFKPSVARDYAQRQRDDQQWIDDHRVEIDAWYEIKKQVEQEFGVDWDWHGHCDYTAPHLSAYDFAEASCTDTIDLTELPPVDPAWREQLDRWLAEFNIPAPQDAPRWWAVASYS